MSLEVQEEEDTEDDVKVFDMSLRSSSEEVINALFYPVSNLGKIVFLDEGGKNFRGTGQFFDFPRVST